MAEFKNVEDVTEDVPALITEEDEQDEAGSELQDDEEEEEKDENEEAQSVTQLLNPNSNLQEIADDSVVDVPVQLMQDSDVEVNPEFREIAIAMAEEIEAKSLEVVRLQKELEDREIHCNELEQRNHEISEQNENLSMQLNGAHRECETLKGTVAEYATNTQQLDDNLDEIKQQLEDKEQTLNETKSFLFESQERVKELSIPPPDVPGADRQELLRLLDRRQHEIVRLSDEWKSLSCKLETTSAKKSEFQTKYDEVITQEASLRLREQLLQQEKQLVKNQNEWLSQELQSKSDQVLQLKKERASTMTDLESKLSAKDQETKRLNSVLESLRQSHSELETKAKEYLSRLKDDREEQATIEEQLKKELSQQAKLTDLYHRASDDAESRVKELVGAVEKLQTLIEEVSQEKDQLQLQIDEEISRHESQEQERLSEVSQLKQELSHANDLLTSLRQQRGAMLSQSEVLSLSPAAAKASAMLKSGQSLTQIYSQYVEVSEELQLQKDENLRLNNYIEQIVQELDEKAPALQQLRRDYDLAEQNCSQLTQKLNAMFEECESLRLESEDTRRHASADSRENERLKQLCSDLGRQVKVLLKECEEARGGVASTSMSHDLSSGDISSSSQVISQHLVDFKNIDELQEQNQRLLKVVRELSEQNEERERQTVEQQTEELQRQLSTAQSEIDELREARERQKELVQSIVNQRDMYRTLLAQTTPLPRDTQTLRSSGCDTSSLGEGEMQGEKQKQVETAKTLKEMKEQFEAYRKEKKENDSILQKQMDEFRDQSSNLRLDNAKLSSKLEYANERYQLLDSHHKALKRELDALREKNQQLSTTLSKQQTSVHTATQELFSLQERLSKAEIAYQSMRTERDLLKASERQARSQYNDLLREQKGQNTLLTNLQAIQNNLEKSEFETKTRLGAKIEALEKELVLYKDKLHSEEDRRTKMVDAYETRVKDLDQRLNSSKDAHSLAEERLRSSEERAASLQTKLSSTKQELDYKLKELQESKDKVLRLEQNAAGEFRGKIRLLERNLADFKGKVKSLETQLSSTKSHADQYKEMSTTYEQQLKELNETSEEFKSRVEQAQSEAETRQNELKLRVDDLETAIKEKEEEMQKVTEEWSQQVSDWQTQVASQESEKVALQLELTSHTEELETLREDVKRYLDAASSTQSLYQRELLQHSKSMENLVATQDKLNAAQSELAQLKLEKQQITEQLSVDRESWTGKEAQLIQQCQNLESRVTELTQQNSLLHDELEKLSAQLLTVQQQTQELDTSFTGDITTDSIHGDKSTDQLWEIIRYVRREKEIAQTKRELAESENTRNQQLVEHLQRQLTEAQDQLREVGEAARVHSETAAQHAEILSKVETLNVLSDSNKLLRAERDSLSAQIKELEQRCEKLEGDMVALRETNKQLTAQKDVLVAEKTALRNEAQRWSTRTNQLIEQYNKVDPEEYKKLLDERESTASKLENLEKEVNSLQSQLADAQSAKEKLEGELSEVRGEKETLTGEMKQLQSDVASKQEGLQAKDKLIHRLRDIGRKFRTKNEESQKENKELKEEIEALKKKLEEASALSETPPVTSEQQDKTKELEEAIEELQASKAQLEEKNSKMGTMVKAAKTKIQSLRTETTKAAKELEDSKAAVDKHSADLTKSQQELKQLREKHAADTKKQEMIISKLQQMLKERRPRHKAVVPISEGSSSLPTSQSTAPTAAVKPTVTTTPTASIRPMAIQTTSAPTAHVTPTMVTLQHVPASTTTTPFMTSNQISSNVVSNSTAAATMFVRSSSPQIVTPLTTTSISVASTTSTTPPIGIAVASQDNNSVSGEGTSRGTVKRQREDDVQEPGSTLETPASKRQRPILQQQQQQQQQQHVAASTSLAPDTQGEGEGVSAMDTQPSDSQVLAVETQVEEQPSASEPVAPENSTTSLITQAKGTTQVHVVGVAAVSTESMGDVANTSSVSSQVGWSSPIVSSATQSRVSESPPAQVTQSREATQIRVSDSSGLGIVQPMQAHIVDPVKVPSSEAMQVPAQSAEISLVQTTSEAGEVSRQEEPSSEVQPVAETPAVMVVADSDSQQALPTTAHVDSSESILSGDLTREAAIRSTQAMAESCPATSRAETSVVHIGIVEPNRLQEVDVEMSQEQGGSESVSETQLERDSSEVRLLDEQVEAELSGQSREATLEQADTTQEEELRVVSEPVSELTSEVEGELVVEMGEEEEEEDVDVVGGDSGEGKDVISIPVEQEEEEERMEEEEDEEESIEESETTGESQEDEEDEDDVDEDDDDEGTEVDEMAEAEEETERIDEYSQLNNIPEDVGTGEGSQSAPIVIDSDEEKEVSDEDEEYQEEDEVQVKLSDDEEISEDSDSVERDGGVEPTESHDQGVDGVEPTESHDQGVGGEQVAESSNQQQPHQPLVYQRSTSSLESEQSSSGLPEDEVSMEIPTSSAHAQPPLRPTSFPSIQRGRIHQFGERQTSVVTPQTFEVHAEDSVVPHTPVLSEVKQLVGNMGQTIPSTPSEPSYIVPQLAESSLTAESLRASEVIQSLGESQIELGSAIVPPPHHPLEVSHDQSHDPNLLVSQDGDINDVVIDDIVGRDSSPEDEEELPEEGELDDDDENDQLEQQQDEPPEPEISTGSTIPTLFSTSGQSFIQPVSSQDTAVQEQALPPPPPLRPLDPTRPVASSSVGGDVGQESSATSGETAEQAPKRKRQLIVWDEPSSSSGGAPQNKGNRGRKIVRFGSSAAQGSRRNIRLKPSRK